MNAKLALIVEDNPLLSKLFSRALGDIGYLTIILEDGRIADEWLKNYEPHLLLLDMHLPYISGDKILEKIRDDVRFANTFFVIVTADARMGDLMASKADFLLNKPVDIQQLQQLGRRLQGLKRAQPGFGAS